MHISNIFRTFAAKLIAIPMKHVLSILLAFLFLAACTGNPQNSQHMEMNIKEKDIIIIDPVYFISNNEIWLELISNLDKSVLGFSEGIIAELSDYRQTEIVDQKGNLIGEWCSDSGLLGCFLLEEVLAFSNHFAKDSANWANYCVVIRDFTGKIVFDAETRRIPCDFLGEGKYEDAEILSIKGIGEPSFDTKYLPTEIFTGE